MIRVLTGATLIDGTGAAPVADAVIVIDGERIAAAGPRQGLSWPGDAEVVDVRGKTIIPGLIDAHDHMASHGYALATRFGLDEPASTAHLRTARVLAEALAMGYTTIRAGGGPEGGRRVVRPRVRAGADVIKTAPTGGASSRAGHGPRDAAFSLPEMQALATESHAPRRGGVWP